MIELRYGSYTHEPDECVVVISGSIARDQRLNAYSKRVRWDVSGQLIVATEGDLKAAIEALETAYAADNQDIGLYDSSTGLATAHLMRNRDTFSGIKVIAPPSYPIGTGAELSVYRSYSLAVEGEFLVAPNAANNVQQFSEQLEFVGTGGARHVWLTPLEGDPERQEVSQRSTFRVVQSGSATGLMTYPAPPGPFWPEFEKQDERRIARIGPARSFQSSSVLGHHQFTTQWTYNFEAIIPMEGNPNYS